jgi:hypothetical protein
MGRLARRIALTVALAAAAALPAIASAGPVIRLASSGSPSVAVDPGGAAHVVAIAGPSEDPEPALRYCRIPAGGRACDLLTLLPRLPHGFPHPRIFVHPDSGVLTVIDTRGYGDREGLWAMTSSDRGATWSAPARLATGGQDLVDAAPSSDGAAVNVIRGDDSFYNDRGNVFQSRAIAGPLSPGGLILDRATARQDDERTVYQAHAVGTLPDGRLFVLGREVRSGAGKGTGIRVLNAGDPNNLGGWSPWSPVAPLSNEDPSIASGPGGTWVMEKAGHRYGSAGTRYDAWEVRPVSNAARLGAPQTLTSLYVPYGSSGGGDLFQDPAGGLHAVWLATSEGCWQDARCLVYRHRPPGRRFGLLTSLYAGSFSHGVFFPQVAANAAGAGWATWQDDVSLSTVRVTPLEESRAARVGGAVIAISAPGACVRRAAGLDVGVSVRPRAGSGILLTRAVFALREFPNGPAHTAVDERAPLSARFDLRHREPGEEEELAATRRLRVAVTYRRGGATRTLTLTQPIDICSNRRTRP